MGMTEDWSGLGIPGSGDSWRLFRYAYIYIFRERRFRVRLRCFRVRFRRIVL